MLRSPLVALGKYRWSAAAVVVSLAAMLWFGASLGAVAAQVEEAGAKWWENFHPVVYLEAEVDPGVLAELVGEVEGWPGVGSLEIREPAAALRTLQEKLGEDEVQRLGVDERMMPTALLLSPTVWQPGQVELVARLKALEVRDEVVGVDVPDGQTLQWLNQGKRVLSGLGLAAFIGLLGALGGLAGFLRRLQEDERWENHLLEVFGAAPGVLRRASFWRGAALGAGAGVLAGAGFLPWALALDDIWAKVLGASAEGAVQAGLGAIGLVLIGLVLGGVTGWLVGEPAKRKSSGGMETLLRWEWERS